MMLRATVFAIIAAFALLALAHAGTAPPLIIDCGGKPCASNSTRG